MKETKGAWNAFHLKTKKDKSMKLKVWYILLIIMVVVLTSCDIHKSNAAPDATFVKVYESHNTDENYYPLSIIENGESGYLIASALIDSSSQVALFPRVYVLAVDKAGEVIASQLLDIQYVNPVSSWVQLNNKNYLVCMDNTTSNTRIIEVELSGTEISVQPASLSSESLNPLFSWNDDDNLLILSYSFISRNSKIECFDKNLNPIWESTFSAKQDFEEEVTRHMQKRGTEYPFFIGAFMNANGSKDYFANCLENQSLTLLFLQGSSGSITGRIYGQGLVGAISALVQITDTSMAISRYDKGDNYIFPGENIDRNTLNNTNDFIGRDIPLSQLKADAKTKAIIYSQNDKNYLLYASTTKNNQIILLFFNPETGEQVYTHYLGYGNPVEIVEVKITSDNGLAVLGKTWISERYKRIIFYKVSADQLDLD